MDSSRLRASSSQTVPAAPHRGGCGRRDPHTHWPPAGKGAPAWALKRTRCPAAPHTTWPCTTLTITGIWTLRASFLAQVRPPSWLSRSSAPCTAEGLSVATSASPQHQISTQVHSLSYTVTSIKTHSKVIGHSVIIIIIQISRALLWIPKDAWRCTHVSCSECCPPLSQ